MTPEQFDALTSMVSAMIQAKVTAHAYQDVLMGGRVAPKAAEIAASAIADARKMFVSEDPRETATMALVR
jgi:hypothetical protein